MRTYLYRVFISCATICLATLNVRGDASPQIDGMYYWLYEESKTAMFQAVNPLLANDYPDVIIPDYVLYEGVKYKVTSIKPVAFQNNFTLRSISISGNVDEIGDFAFRNCRNLESVRFEDSENPIKVGYNDYNPQEKFEHKYEGLFHDCPIKELYLGRETTLSYDGWDYSPFYVNDYNSNSGTWNTNHLERVTIGKLVKSLPDYYFLNSTHLNSVDCGTGLKQIGKNCFLGCVSLSTISLSNNLAEIGEGIFCHCKGLTTIELPTGISIIPNRAFEDCSALEMINFSGDILSLGESAFYGCNKLKDIYLGKALNDIGDYCFYGCWSLVKIAHNSNIKDIGEYAFHGCSKLESFSIPNSISILNDGVFAGCGSLKSVAGIDHIKSLGKCLFQYCESLSDIELSDEITVLPEKLFYGCEQLANVKLGDKISVIKKEAFAYCRSLKFNSDIFNCLEEIGDLAFCGCNSLDDFPKSNRLLNIGNSAFLGCDSFQKITIPTSVKTLGEECFRGCDQLTDIIIEDCKEEIYIGSNLTYQSPIDNIYIGRNIIGQGFSESTVQRITFGNNVTQIPEKSFTWCKSLLSVTLSNSISQIGDRAFWGCFGITSVYYAAVNPISADKTIFSDDVYTNATLYVPLDAMNMIREIEPWKNFVCRTNHDFSGTGNIPYVGSDNSPYEIYNINGMLISKTFDSLDYGTYIIRQGNIVKKIVVK